MQRRAREGTHVGKVSPGSFWAERAKTRGVSKPRCLSGCARSCLRHQIEADGHCRASPVRPRAVLGSAVLRKASRRLWFRRRRGGGRELGSPPMAVGLSSVAARACRRGKIDTGFLGHGYSGGSRGCGRWRSRCRAALGRARSLWAAAGHRYPAAGGFSRREAPRWGWSCGDPCSLRYKSAATASGCWGRGCRLGLASDNANTAADDASWAALARSFQDSLGAGRGDVIVKEF